ncbi:macrophage mannose receptor 1-like [Seriola dumerili]|uniref:Macrophage mannose receptor 1-like n=1 Tax=Seriola dumerili TaxID=41447 RepID=A0A3B4VN74_SERDU|nr:macrophage mannose receptor 1-like [Seriola dumerili]
MEKALLSIIAASALCAVSSHAARQYHFVYEEKNMKEARSYCREKYTDLATIDNMEEMNILNAAVDLNQMVNSSYLAWIGLYEDVNSWRWSLSDRSLGQAEYRNWAPKEPNNENGENCGQMYDYGKWNDDNCEGHLMAVCIDVRGSSETHVLINKSMTWTEAQSYCRANHTDLTSVRNLQENQKVMNLVPSKQQVWIGLFRDSWKWLDGSNSSFRHWSENEPNNKRHEEKCVAANFENSGKWEDWNCDHRRAFICYSVVSVSKKVVRVKLVKRSSSLDLNHPAVMEDILKQLKQRLKNKGVNEDIKLSWTKQSDGKSFHSEKETKKNTISARDDL